MNKQKHGNVKYPFADLDIGQAFLVPAGRVNSMRTALNKYNKNNPDKKIYINYDKSQLTGEVEIFRVRRPISA